MVYLHITARTVPGKTQEFHDFWSRTSLPMWEKYGAKHIGSWDTFIGDYWEVVRLFAFDDLAHLERYERFLAQDKEGQELVKELASYIVSISRKILRPAAYSPLQ